MPETIGTLIIVAVTDLTADAAAAAAFEIAGVTVTYASIIGATVLAAASLALQSALTPSAPKVDGQLSLQQTIPFRRRGYGRVKLGGYFTFWTSVNGTLYSIIALLAHEIDAFEEYWVSDRRVALDGSGNVTSVTAPANADPAQFNPGGTHPVRILSSRGNSGKTAYAPVIAAFPGIWTSQHIGIGICDALLIEGGVSQNDYPKVYPGGQQTLRILLRAAKIYDPRDPAQNINTPSTWTWSDNAVAVILDYLSHADGWRIPKSIFLTGLAQAVTLEALNDCDDAVPLKSGGTEKRYRIWGFYDYNEEPRQVLGRMLAACGGWLQMMPDGTIGIRAGKWVEPDFTITDDMVLGYEVQHFVGEFDAINQIRANFYYPGNDYQDTEVLPLENTADIAQRGYTKATTLDARHAPSYTQVARIQKIAMAEAEPEYSLTLTLNMAGLPGRNRKFLNLQLTQLGLSGTFRVTAFTVNLATAVITVGLASFGSAAYDWNPATDEPDAPPVPPDSSSLADVESPTNFAASVQSATIGSVYGPVLVLSCDPPSDRSDLTVKFEYQPNGVSSWTVVSQGTQTFQTQTPILADGTYNVRASFFSPSGQQSAFATINGVVVTTSISAPGVPVNLAVANDAGKALVTFEAPNSPTVYDCKVYRNSTNTFGSATGISGAIYCSPNQPLAYEDNPGAGTWYYWATAESASGVASSPAGSVSITI